MPESSHFSALEKNRLFPWPIIRFFGGELCRLDHNLTKENNVDNVIKCIFNQVWKSLKSAFKIQPVKSTNFKILILSIFFLWDSLLFWGGKSCFGIIVTLIYYLFVSKSIKKVQKYLNLRGNQNGFCPPSDHCA